MAVIRAAQPPSGAPIGRTVVMLVRLRTGNDPCFGLVSQAAAGATIEGNPFRNPWGNLFEVAVCVQFSKRDALLRGVGLNRKKSKGTVHYLSYKNLP